MKASPARLVILLASWTVAKLHPPQPHPAAEIFPVMADADFAGLVADIKQSGQLEPIVIHDNQILDGRHRYRACEQLGIEPITVEWKGRWQSARLRDLEEPSPPAEGRGVDMLDTTTGGRQPPILRPFQIKAVDDVEAAIAAGKRRMLLVAPTGAGKTVVLAELVRRTVERGGRALVLAHRRELVGQASRKLHAVGLDHGIIAPEFPARPGEPVQVASIPTLHARAVRSNLLQLPPANLLVVDEAHHSTAQTWRRIIEAYPGAAVVGPTATPCRADGRGLGGLFEGMVECPAVAELIGLGFLVPTRVYAPSRPDLDGVRTIGGDWNEKQLAERMDRPQLVGDVVSHWHRLAERRRTIVFATSIEHSAHLADEFGRAGVAAAHLDGATPIVERDAIMARLASGALDIVVNCGVIGEGVDVPDVGCIVMARPTKSIVLFRQQVGRGLRPAPGKPDCIVIDHAGAVFEHGHIDEPIAWALAPDKRAERPRKTARDAGRAPKLSACPECTATRWEGQPCAVCGWRPTPKRRAVDFVDGDLGAVDRDMAVRRQDSTIDERYRFHAELAHIARERGYASGWAAHKFREKFGAWPPSRIAPAPIEPRPETRSWVRSRAIAWARSQDKARAQAGAA
ncbi:MAG: DEAD/DEAH box helicase [Rhodospirillales bacterium]|nr:DEAD/DEAH box helicase [Rhodospirillales bacterium]